MEMIKDQNPDEEFLEQVRRQTQKVMEEFLTAAKMKPGQVLVVGCSSSEIGSFRHRLPFQQPDWKDCF